MLLKTGKFYAVRVEDLKPVNGHELGETCDADELVYLVRTDVEGVVLADVRVCVDPQLHEAA